MCRTPPRCYNSAPAKFLYVGHLEAVKRVDLILVALSRVASILPPNWHFDIVGSGPLSGDLIFLCEKLGISDHVTFHGRISSSESLRDCYHNADVFLMASYSEGASRALIEAMSFSLPIISTKVGNAAALLHPLALVSVNDLTEYCNCLRLFVLRPSLLTDLSKRNYDRAQQFSREILISKRISFWKSAVHVVSNAGL